MPDFMSFHVHTRDSPATFRNPDDIGFMWSKSLVKIFILLIFHLAYI